MVKSSDGEQGTDLFVQGLLYSAVNIGGYTLSGYLTRNYNSFSASLCVVWVVIFAVAVKLVNFYFFDLSVLKLSTTFLTVLLTSSLIGISVLNHSKIIRPDLQFVSVSTAVAISAFVS